MTTQPDTTTTPARRPPRKPRFLLLLVQVQAIYLVGASAGRVIIMLSTHTNLDALPFIGFSLGVVSILAATNWSHR